MHITQSGRQSRPLRTQKEVNAFTSKYDYYLKNPKKYPLTKQELRGLRLFEDKKKGKCAECHPSRRIRAAGRRCSPILPMTTLVSPGIRKSLACHAERFESDGVNWVDRGLSDFLRTVPRFAQHAENNMGKHKVPTVRNVDKRPSADFVKAYGHNGYFKSLKEVVHFYNVRDRLPYCSKTAECSARHELLAGAGSVQEYQYRRVGEPGPERRGRSRHRCVPHDAF